MKHTTSRTSPVLMGGLMGGLLAMLGVLIVIPAFAGSESNITNPGSSAPATPAAAPANPATETSDHGGRAEKRKNAEPEKRTASKPAPRHARQAAQPASQAAPAPAARPMGVSIGIGGMSVGF
jgi:hypothetical protein